MAPSLLSADFSDLGAAIQKIERARAPLVHIDVMDGSFVPQISYGQPAIKSLRPRTGALFDVHLMIERPELHVESFADAGADWLTFHWEAAVHHNRVIERIQSLGRKAGISVVPSTPVSALEEVLPDVDVVLVMTVNPGFGGQELIPSALRKVERLVRLRRERSLGYLVSVDGGVNARTLPDVLRAGADVVVSGSAFFSGTLGWEAL